MYYRNVMVALALIPATLVAQGGGGGGGPQQQAPKNLQVLPKNFTRGQVVQVMRGVAGGLGVRCDYCHVESPDGNFQNTDFASDAKDTKKTAREMLKMVMDLNQRVLPGMGRTLTERTQISCVTCHHGLAKPRTLQAEVEETYDKSGIDSAMTKYRTLRDRYYGRAAYDFGEFSLLDVADELRRKPEQRTDAMRILQLNLEFNPKSVATLTGLGTGSLQLGDTAAAIANFQKVVELDPDNALAKRMLGSLKK